MTEYNAPHGVLGAISAASISGSDGKGSLIDLSSRQDLTLEPGATACAGAKGSHADVFVGSVGSNDYLVAAVGRPRFIDEALSGTAEREGIATAFAHAYAEHGPAFLSWCRGSFSIALVDRSRGVAHVAVDRVGIESVYFTLDEKANLWFAHDGAVGLLDQATPLTIDPQALYSYFFFHMIPSPRTVFHGVEKLEPGQMLTFDNRGLSKSYYWKPTFEPTPEADLESKLHDTLQASIDFHQDHQTVAAFLSGGIDSSTVAGKLANNGTDRVTTYSMGFDVPGYDEIPFAEATAKHFNVPLNKYYVTPNDVIEAIHVIAEGYDEPFGNSSAIPTYHCAKLAAKDGHSVILAGDGGDELFAGNERYRTQLLFAIYDLLPAVLRERVFEPLFCKTLADVKFFPIRKLRSYIEQARLPMPDRLHTYNYLHRFDPAEIFTAAFLSRVEQAEPMNDLRAVWNRAPNGDLVDKMLYLDWKQTLADNDLRKVNRMCASAGIEVRYPLLDDDLVEFSTKVPSTLKLKWMKLRYFYRHAMRNFLPESTLNKSKHGFGLPFGPWLAESHELQTVVRTSLHSFSQRNIINPDFIHRLNTDLLGDHAAYYGEMVWLILTLEQWLGARESFADYAIDE